MISFKDTWAGLRQAVFFPLMCVLRWNNLWRKMEKVCVVHWKQQKVAKISEAALELAPGNDCVWAFIILCFKEPLTARDHNNTTYSCITISCKIALGLRGNKMLVGNVCWSEYTSTHVNIRLWSSAACRKTTGVQQNHYFVCLMSNKGFFSPPSNEVTAGSKPSRPLLYNLIYPAFWILPGL